MCSIVYLASIELDLRFAFVPCCQSMEGCWLKLSCPLPYSFSLTSGPLLPCQLFLRHSMSFVTSLPFYMWFLPPGFFSLPYPFGKLLVILQNPTQMTPVLWSLFCSPDSPVSINPHQCSPGNCYKTHQSAGYLFLSMLVLLPRIATGAGVDYLHVPSPGPVPGGLCVLHQRWKNWSESSFLSPARCFARLLTRITEENHSWREPWGTWLASGAKCRGFNANS